MLADIAGVLIVLSVAILIAHARQSRILINTNSGSDNTQFVFYYLCATKVSIRRS